MATHLGSVHVLQGSYPVRECASIISPHVVFKHVSALGHATEEKVSSDIADALVVAATILVLVITKYVHGLKPAARMSLMCTYSISLSMVMTRHTVIK